MQPREAGSMEPESVPGPRVVVNPIHHPVESCACGALLFVARCARRRGPDTGSGSKHTQRPAKGSHSGRIGLPKAFSVT